MEEKKENRDAKQERQRQVTQEKLQVKTQEARSASVQQRQQIRTLKSMLISRRTGSPKLTEAQ